VSKSAVKDALRILAEQAVQQVAVGDHPLEYFGGATALYDTRRDEAINKLPAFEKARTELGALQVVQERYGQSESERLALQFVYGFLGTLSESTFGLGIFETAWEAFWEELSEPEWTWLGLANLTNFRSNSLLLDIGDGITIRGRSFEELAGMGWTEWHLKQLSQEWNERGGSSTHVILTEHRLPKVSDNFVLSDTTGYQKAVRALLALRLRKDGDIGMGRMWFLRPVAFNLGLGGYSSTGYPASFAAAFGNAYTLDEPELSSVRDVYDTLIGYESARDMAPVNLDLALRSFSDIYERQTFRYDTRLVDAVTAAEALLGTRTELSFRLPFRVAAILGRDHDDRLDIFKQMRDHYDVRSAVVHGSSLSSRQRQRLEDTRDLRQWLRQLLVGFLRLTTSSGHSFDTSFFDRSIDIALVDDTRRSELRVAMGLE